MGSVPDSPDNHGSVNSGRRTAAATAARRLRAAQKAAVRLGLEQLEHLDDEHLLALTEVLISECVRRRIAEKIFGE